MVYSTVWGFLGVFGLIWLISLRGKGGICIGVIHSEDVGLNLSGKGRDCIAKQEILQPLVDRDLTSENLFKFSSYSGRKTAFTSHLTRYVKQGYVLKLGKRPSTYRLTDLGREECIDNPFKWRIAHSLWNKQPDENMDALLETLILENSRLKHEMEDGREEGNDSGKGSGGRVKGNSGSSRSGGRVRDTVDSSSLDALCEDLGLEDGETPKSLITSLRAENSALLAKSKSVITTLRETVRTLNTEKRVLENEVATLRSMPSVKPRSVGTKSPSKLQIARMKLVVVVQNELGGHFTFDVFEAWGMYPYRVKGNKLFKKGDVEILSPRDREVTGRAGHAKPLSPNAVWDCGFCIEKVNKKSIVVNGSGLAEPKTLMF